MCGEPNYIHDGPVQLRRPKATLITVEQDGGVTLDHYAVYIRSIQHRLSPSLKSLSDPDRLMPWNPRTFHDADITGFSFSKARGSTSQDRLVASVTLRNGCEVTLAYADLMKVLLPRQVGGLSGRIYYHELHLLPLGCIRHLITFRQSNTVEIWSRQLHVEESRSVPVLQPV
jgi:hypothetical protein